MNQKMDDERADSTKSSEDKMRIELPPRVNIKDIISIFADSKLLAILDLLSKKKMTISQLGENLGLSPQNAHHSVETLVDSGLPKFGNVVSSAGTGYQSLVYDTDFSLDNDKAYFLMFYSNPQAGSSNVYFMSIKVEGYEEL